VLRSFFRSAFGAGTNVREGNVVFERGGWNGGGKSLGRALAVAPSILWSYFFKVVL
jgi:hypothetical protein